MSYTTSYRPATIRQDDKLRMDITKGAKDVNAHKQTHTDVNCAQSSHSPAYQTH